MNAFVTVSLLALAILVVYVLLRLPKYEASAENTVTFGHFVAAMLILLIGILVGGIPSVSNFTGNLYRGALEASAPQAQQPASPQAVPAAPAAPLGAAPNVAQQPQPAAPLPDITGVRWHKEDKRAVSFPDPPTDSRWVIIHKRSQVPQGDFVDTNEFRVPVSQQELQDVKVYLQFRNGNASQAVVLQPEDAPPAPENPPGGQST